MTDSLTDIEHFVFLMQENRRSVVAALPRLSQCVTSIVPTYLGDGRPYRVSYPQTMPTQETSPARGIPSGAC